MDNWLKLTLLILTCYRSAQLFAFDEGPSFGLFKKGIFFSLRKELGAYDYAPNGEATTNLGRMMTCPYCLGVWIALVLALFAYPVETAFIYWLPIAGGQSFLQSMGNR